MSLRENSPCLSPCPFLNKDLRLPRQRRLRQAPSATGAASEGHKSHTRFPFLPFSFFFPPLFFLVSSSTFPTVLLSGTVAQTIDASEKNSLQEPHEGCCRSPSPPNTSASRCLTDISIQPRVPCVLRAWLLWLLCHVPHPALVSLHFCIPQMRGLCIPLPSPWSSLACWVLLSCILQASAPSPALVEQYQAVVKAGEREI